MRDKACVYCKQKFHPTPNHPTQFACNSAECQRRRRADYHRKKVATDPLYREQCRDSRRKWRERNADRRSQYDKAYRARQQIRGTKVQRSRLLNEVRRLRELLKRDATFELRAFGPNILLVFSQALLGKRSRWQPRAIWWRNVVRSQSNTHRHQGSHFGLQDEFLDRMVLNLIGYRELRMVARLLHQSKRAVWSRVLRLQESSSVRLDYSKPENNPPVA